jgi:hypothetical protein
VFDILWLIQNECQFSAARAATGLSFPVKHDGSALLSVAMFYGYIDGILAALWPFFPSFALLPAHKST